MPEGSFEPTVMFFGLTNSPAMFQAIMNDLLRDLVVEEKVTVFIDVKIIDGGLYFIFSFFILLFFSFLFLLIFYF